MSKMISKYETIDWFIIIVLHDIVGYVRIVHVLVKAVIHLCWITLFPDIGESPVESVANLLYKPYI